MSDIKIIMKDGSVREFLHEGRVGGSYSKSLKLENGFAVITDEWYKKTVIPASDIAEIEERPLR